MPLSPATPEARLRAPLGAAAGARPGAGLAALILALLVRLFVRTDAAWNLSREYECRDANHVDPYSPVIVMPAIGCAPHAACIEAGLAPDWILTGIRTRGMRPAARPARERPRALPARAPPGTHLPPR